MHTIYGAFNEGEESAYITVHPKLEGPRTSLSPSHHTSEDPSSCVILTYQGPSAVPLAGVLPSCLISCAHVTFSNIPVIRPLFVAFLPRNYRYLVFMQDIGIVAIFTRMPPTGHDAESADILSDSGVWVGQTHRADTAVKSDGSFEMIKRKVIIPGTDVGGAIMTKSRMHIKFIGLNDLLVTLKCFSVVFPEAYFSGVGSGVKLVHAVRCCYDPLRMNERPSAPMMCTIHQNFHLPWPGVWTGFAATDNSPLSRMTILLLMSNSAFWEI